MWYMNIIEYTWCIQAPLLRIATKQCLSKFPEDPAKATAGKVRHAKTVRKACKPQIWRVQRCATFWCKCGWEVNISSVSLGFRFNVHLCTSLGSLACDCSRAPISSSLRIFGQSNNKDTLRSLIVVNRGGKIITPAVKSSNSLSSPNVPGSESRPTSSATLKVNSKND